MHDIEGVGGKPDESLSDALDPFDEDNEPYLDNAIDGRTFRGTVYTGIPEQLLAGTEAGKIDVVARATYSSRAIARLTDALRARPRPMGRERQQRRQGERFDKTNAPDEPTPTRPP
ncbi:MAG: FMN-binding protein [Collinsella sp.]